MTEFNIALLTVGLLVLLVGLASEWLQSRSVLSEPLIALVLGTLLGPLGFGWLSPQGWGDEFAITEEVARVTLALSLVGTALRLPRGYLRGHGRSLAMMLGAVMPLMWLVMAGLGVLVGLPLVTALLVGAVVTPTDPVIASAIVAGKTAQNNIPSRLRHLLSAESGANDGLAYPLVLLPILLLTRPAGEVLGVWLGRVVAWEVLGAALIGAGLGWLTGRLLQWVRPGQPDAVHLTSVGAFAFTVLAGAKLLVTDGVFAVFVAGVVLVATSTNLARTGGIQEALNRFFVLPVFALLGLLLPWQAWLGLGWRGPVLVLGALLLRRLPVVLALRRLVPALRDRRDALLIGWFGPIGVGALFYGALAQRETGLTLPWTVGSLLVVASVVAHGLSATPLTRWFGRSRQAGAGEVPPDDGAEVSGVASR